MKNQQFDSWLKHYFDKYLTEVNERCANPSSSLLDIFADLDDNDLWTMLISGRYSLYPNIKARLPKIADAETQNNYNSQNGWDLLNRARLSFEKIIKLNKDYGTNPAIKDNKILDFGVGWGRIIRFFLKEVPQDQLFGCDTSPVIIDTFKKLNVPVDVRKSEGLPTSLPYEDNTFDIIYSNSVFTHLSEESTAKCFDVIHKVLKPKGLFYFTTWSPNYVMHSPKMTALGVKPKFKHADERFDFLPANGNHPFFGATFISYPYMQKHWTEQFEIVKVEMQAFALNQIVILLRKK